MDFQDHQQADPFGRPPQDSFGQPAGPPGNFFGTASLWIGIGQIFTCGLLSPIGLLCSLIGLLKEPRQNAWIGLLLNGAVGLTLLMGTLITAATLGIGIFAAKTAADFVQTRAELDEARVVIMKYAKENDGLPDTEMGNELLAEMGEDYKFKYTLDGNKYTITAAGADGEFDTYDDGEASGRRMPDGSYINTDRVQPGQRRPYN